MRNSIVRFQDQPDDDGYPGDEEEEDDEDEEGEEDDEDDGGETWYVTGFRGVSPDGSCTQVVRSA